MIIINRYTRGLDDVGKSSPETGQPGAPDVSFHQHRHSPHPRNAVPQPNHRRDEEPCMRCYNDNLNLFTENIQIETDRPRPSTILRPSFPAVLSLDLPFLTP